MKSVRLKKLPAAGLRLLARYRWLRGPIKYGYALYHRRNRWERPHPIDVEYGTDTKGFVPGWLLGASTVSKSNVAYLGCQPTALRQALSTIPRLEDCIFVDLGCGKGRALVVATEFPFKRILGIELDPNLAATARKNASIMSARDPGLTTIEVIEGNVLNAAFPAGRKVIFNYHAFGADVLDRLYARFTHYATAENEELYFVYMNPVHGFILDQSALAERWDARTIALAGQDLECSLDGQETTVVWRLSPSMTSPKPVRPGEEIRIVLDGLRAQLAMDGSAFAAQA